MTGLQGASAMIAPGTLVWPLIKAAGNSDFRCAKVARVIRQGNAVTGVALAGGEEIMAEAVLSSLSGPATLALAGAVSPAPQIGEARLLLGLRQAIALPSARLIVAERAGIYADAHETACAGQLPSEVPMELTAAAPDKIAVTIRPVPAVLTTEQRVQLAARAVQALSRQAPGAASLVNDVQYEISSSPVRASLGRLLAPAVSHVKTNVTGLYLCGADAEPLPSVSGRAARIAAGLVTQKKL